MKPALIIVLTVLSLSCSSPYSSHTQKVKTALDKVDYQDGINNTEAKAIADAYLIHHGTYKGRPSYARITDGEGVWLGEVLVIKSLASPVSADLPPVIVDKKSGAVRWQYGPDVEKINLEDTDSGAERAS